MSTAEISADALVKRLFSDVRLFFHPRTNEITGCEAVSIFKRSLEDFYSDELLRERSILSNPGETKLMSIIDVSGYAVTKETVISILRRLCKKSSICNIFSSHGITFARSNDIMVSYRFGESFELNEFSTVDLDLKSRSLKKKMTVRYDNKS